MTIEIADRLIKLRKKYGYSQEELADKLGLSRQAVSKWERAEASPDTDNLICLAKIYGVSLDELLATDEDVDTIVKEQVKQDAKEETKEEPKSESKHDRVIIDDTGVHVHDEDGSSVVIDKSGVHCYDKDNNCIKSKSHRDNDKVMAVIGCVEGALFLLAAAAYMLLGFLGGLWRSGWIVFFLPDIICSIARAIRKKNADKFNMPFFTAFIFFFVCMFLVDTVGIPELWHVMWVVFILVPVYYTTVTAINKAIGKDKIFSDSDDDDDDEDKEVKVKADIDLTINDK